MTRIIADIKNEADAKTLFRVIKKFSSRVKMMDEQQWEDYLLGIMALESEKEGTTVPREEVSKWFRKYGIDF